MESKGTAGIFPLLGCPRRNSAIDARTGTAAFIGPRRIPLSIQDSTSEPQTHRHWLALGFSFALTAITLFFVFRGIDRRAFVRLLATLARRCGRVSFHANRERWRSVLCALMRGPPPSVASVQAVFYASIFFNCLPLGTVGGDVARVWLARRFALSLSQIVLSILVDRV